MQHLHATCQRGGSIKEDEVVEVLSITIWAGGDAEMRDAEVEGCVEGDEVGGRRHQDHHGGGEAAHLNPHYLVGGPPPILLSGMYISSGVGSQ